MNTRRGYALAALAAALWALNASISRSLLDDGMDPEHLSQLRSAGSVALLVLALLSTRRDLLRGGRH